MKLLKSLWAAATLTATTIIIIISIKGISLMLSHYFGDLASFVMLVVILFIGSFVLVYSLEKWEPLYLMPKPRPKTFSDEIQPGEEWPRE